MPPPQIGKPPSLNPPPLCTCVKMEPFVLLACFPQVESIFFATKLDISPSKRSYWSAQRAAFEVEKDNGGFGPQDPKQPKCLQNTVKPNKTTTGLITQIDLNWTKITVQQRKKLQKDKWFHFHAATPPPCKWAKWGRFVIFPCFAC